MKNGLYILLTILFFSTCKNEEPPLPNINVSPAFEPFVDSFKEEALKRGYEIDFEDTGLTVLFGNTPNASASCSEIAGHDWGSHRIIVDQNTWQSLNDSLRERLIFHELGHCELNRSHKNDKFTDGSWQSIMRGDPFTIDEEERIPIPYFGFRRDYYIDELFDDAVPFPDWANRSFDFNEIPASSKDLIITKSNINYLNDTIDFEVEDYELEFDIRTIAGNAATWIAWGTQEQHYFFWFLDDEFHFSANSNFQGPFHFLKDEAINFRSNHKVTIRQDGPFCKIFLDEQFFFMVDRLPVDLFFVMSSEENEIEITSYKLSEIL